MRLTTFITDHELQIISEWERFARVHLAAAGCMDLTQRRDHIAGMLKTIARDLDTPQTKREQSDKSMGMDDAADSADTAANAHGTERAAGGFSPIDLVSEFRALRASVLRLWSEAQDVLTRESLDDITRFHEAVDQLLAESLATYAQDVAKSKDLFLGVLGHDLRNPLGAIMMSATVMMSQEGPEWRHTRTATRILNAVTRMDALIGDLVDFTRTRLGAGIPIVRTDMDLEKVCRQTVDEIAAFHPSSELQFTASGELHGSWDSGRVAQALSNLVGNAVQHGGKTPIAVGVRGEADEVVVTVHNEGKQIPTDRMHDIFDPFKQLNPAASKHARSVGLGLYIVQAIVQAHAGSIDVASNETGTTFTMRLPRRVESTG